MLGNTVSWVSVVSHTHILPGQLCLELSWAYRVCTWAMGILYTCVPGHIHYPVCVPGHIARVPGHIARVPAHIVRVPGHIVCVLGHIVRVPGHIVCTWSYCACTWSYRVFTWGYHARTWAMSMSRACTWAVGIFSEHVDAVYKKNITHNINF